MITAVELLAAVYVACWLWLAWEVNRAPLVDEAWEDRLLREIDALPEIPEPVRASFVLGDP